MKIELNNSQINTIIECLTDAWGSIASFLVAGDPK
jgi:hypothetical protein